MELRDWREMSVSAAEMRTPGQASISVDQRTRMRERSRRRVAAALLVLVTILTASIWLGCNGGYAPPPEPVVPTPLPADPADCSSGVTVEGPLANPALVEDCETLLRARDSLVGEGRYLYWSGARSILDWEGVFVDTETELARVVSLNLYAYGPGGQGPC